MASNTKVNFTTPVGRLVMGSLYKPQTTDADGKPLVVKNGPNVGQPTVRYFFAVAIQKGAEKQWWDTEWGAKIVGVAQAGFPQGQWQQPTFAYKVVDGDSQIPNTKGKKPCDREGYPGHWVLSFSSGFAPKIFNRDGSAAIVEPDAVKLGYFVQVNADVDSNGNAMKPGVYLNHNMVALSAYGPEIHVGPDAAAAGFGAAPLPAGATAAPVGGFTPPVPGMPSAPAAPAGVPQYGAPPVPTPGIGAPPASPSNVPVYAPPNPAILQVPPPAAPVAAPVPMAVPQAPAAPVAPVPTGPVMTPAANGVTYAQYRQAGWTDDQLRANGLMI